MSKIISIGSDFKKIMSDINIHEITGNVFTIYSYDPKTMEYISKSQAYEDERNPGKPILPAYSTNIEPKLDSLYNQTVIFDRSSRQWKIIPDYRANTYYSKTTGESKRYDLGETPDFNLYTIQSKPSSDHIWNEGSNSWLIPLSTLKKMKIEELNNRKWHAINTDGVAYNGLMFDTDSDSQLALIEAKLAYDVIGTLPSSYWKARDGILELTKASFLELATTILNLKSVMFNKFFYLAKLVEEANTEEEINAITWDTEVPTNPINFQDLEFHW